MPLQKKSGNLLKAPRILSNIKISIFNTMLISEMTRFLKYDRPTLYRVLSQFHLTGRDDHLVLVPKNVVPIFHHGYP